MPVLLQNKIMLVGCGAMGGALLHGWINETNDSRAEVTVITPHEKSVEPYKDRVNLYWYPHLDSSLKPDVIVFAVKPQIIEKVAVDYKHFVEGGALFVTVAAGKHIKHLQNVLGNSAPIARVMPNLPITYNQGMTCGLANAQCTEGHKKIVDSLFSALGVYEWLEHENDFDTVTAVSGSGPAYVYYLCECLEKAAVQAGLSDCLAHKLARQTIIGVGEMLRQNPDSTAATMRENVTSPQGTTQAALNILMPRMEKLIIDAVLKAKERSIELSK
jgi:pyrroline-5-carboxylate reductase